MTLITVCFDTNCIEDPQGNPHVEQLEEWHRSAVIEITTTSALTQELERNFGPRGAARRHKARGYREGQDSRAFTLRRSGGGSYLRGAAGDTLRGPTAAEYVPPIAAILFPGRQFADLSEHLQLDVLHLATHKLHGWDYFITDDEKHILSQRRRLSEEMGIQVASPADAVREVAARLGGTALSANTCEGPFEA